MLPLFAGYMHMHVFQQRKNKPIFVALVGAKKLRHTQEHQELVHTIIQELGVEPHDIAAGLQQDRTFYSTKKRLRTQSTTKLLIPWPSSMVTPNRKSSSFEFCPTSCILFSLDSLLSANSRPLFSLFASALTEQFKPRVCFGGFHGELLMYLQQIRHDLDRLYPVARESGLLVPCATTLFF